MFFNNLLPSIRNFSSLVTSSLQHYVCVTSVAATKKYLITTIGAFIAEFHVDLCG